MGDLGHPPIKKKLKSRGSVMVFSTFSMRYWQPFDRRAVLTKLDKTDSKWLQIKGEQTVNTKHKYKLSHFCCEFFQKL